VKGIDLRPDKPTMNHFLLCMPLIVVFSANAEPKAISFQSTAQQTALLELYTSEGYSRCPPAETLLSHLRNSPGLWKDFVPAAFHVDYWTISVGATHGPCAAFLTASALMHKTGAAIMFISPASSSMAAIGAIGAPDTRKI